MGRLVGVNQNKKVGFDDLENCHCGVLYTGAELASEIPASLSSNKADIKTGC
jgi:hypothetical protein